MRKDKLILLFQKGLLIIPFFLLFISCSEKITTSYIGQGWSSNSINAVKFRKNALTTHGNFQFVAYYNDAGFLVLGKRKLHSKNWVTQITNYKGNTKDAHNSISLGG